MTIELGVLNDGGVVVVTDTPLPHVVKRIEFYRDPRLFMLVYHTEQQDEDEIGELMHYEVPEHMAGPVEQSPNVLVYTLFAGHPPVGYKVPLVKVGELYE